MLRTLISLALMFPALAYAQMRVDGTRLVVTDASGQEADGAQLEGAELDLGELGTLRITQNRLDSEARFPDELWLLQGQMRRPGATEFSALCPADTKGDTRMLIFSGYLDPGLRYVADPSRFSMSCVSGVEAKCLRWGYLPWRKAPAGEVSLAPYFESCIRMARADYCGNDQPTTRDGTAIDVYDRIGIQQRTPNLPDYAFEAGWAPHGAVCVHHARIPENLALERLPARCPRLTGKVLGSACDENAAESLGALIMQRSIQRGTPDLAIRPI